MQNLFVSIIVATYRRTDELARALESISVQTFRNLEVIIVDDNHNDTYTMSVKRIVSDFSKKNPDYSVKYICNSSNLGSARSRNEGISVCTSDYICFLDDDDVYLPDRVKNQVHAMAEHKADFSLTDLKLFSESDKLIETRRHNYINDTSSSELLKLHLMHHLTGTDTMMFRRDYLIMIGGFSPIDIGDEYYLMQKAIEGNGNFLYLPICDVKAYVHTGDGGLSSGYGKINGENALYEHKKNFFHKLDSKAVRYIKMRHYAVLAYAYLRMKKFGKFFVNAIKSFFSAPGECIRLFFGR